MMIGTKLALALAGLALVGGGVARASAHNQFDGNRPAWVSKLHDALESGDYAAWKAAHQQQFDAMTSEERFNDLKAMQQLMKDGKKAEARQYAKDHNLPMHGGWRRGPHGHGGNGPMHAASES